MYFLDMEYRNICSYVAVLCACLLFGCSADQVSEHIETPVGVDPDTTLVGPVDSGLTVKSSIRFNEVDPVNLVYEDHEGDDAGWVELYNSADTAVNLQGLALSDSRGEPRKWEFGDVSVPPQSFVLVFLSGKDLPNFEAPHDSINMIGTGCWTWTDAQNEPIAGYSYANPLEGNSRNCFKVDGARRIGAVMKFGENEELGWSSISVFVGTNGGDKMDVVDLGNANELLLTGFISKDRVLSLRLTQSDIDDWKGYEITLTGTGDSTTTYRVGLPIGKNFPDLQNIYGTRFSPEANEVQEVTMNVSSYIVRNRGHEPHANFKLDKKEGVLYLTNAQGLLLDSVAYPELPLGKTWSYGLSVDGREGWGYADATPYGMTTGSIYAETPPKVSAELPPSGFYSEAFNVVFDSSKQVRCEQGGKLPTQTSTFTTSVSVSSTMVLRCASFVRNSIPGTVESRTYVFENQPSVPAVFIVTDPNSLFDPDTGIYMEGPNAQAADPHYGANYWLDKELPVFVELMEPQIKTPVFSENAGLQIFGNYSRMQKKKSVAIVFREKYGSKRLNYPLFPDFPELQKFKWFVLRNNGGNYGTNYIQDRLASSLSEGLGVDYQHGRAAIVFYNGEYYGIHNIREKSNEYYFETHYGYDPEEIDLLKADNAATSGSAVDYMALANWLESHHLDSEENYAYLSSLIDVDNFLNYVHTEVFVNNRDWPGNNLKKWRCNNPSTPWRWFLYDLDFGFGNSHSEYTNNIFEFISEENGESWPNGPEYTLLLRRLMENESFKASFINRMTALLSMNFALKRVKARIEMMMSEYDSEMARDQKRWGLSASHMRNGLNTLLSFAESRKSVLMNELVEFFDLGETVPVTLSSSGNGRVLVHGLPLDEKNMTIEFFAGQKIVLTAQPVNGGVFMGWNDGDISPMRVISPENVDSLMALFK